MGQQIHLRNCNRSERLRVESGSCAETPAVLHEPAKHVDQGHVLHAADTCVSNSGISDDDCQGLCPGHGHVESVLVQQELQTSGAEVSGTGTHRNDDHRSFLPLKLVDRSHTGTGRQPITEFSHLQVVRGDSRTIRV